jgi:ribulose-phosphate 3-epimerase
MIKVAPSILSADFANMGNDIAKLEPWGASLVHCDVMDGEFVPNMSFGAQMVKAIRKYTSLPLDVHLMINKPECFIEDFAKAGADIITIHQEACIHLHRTIKLITSCGIKAGVALNPATSISTLENVIDDIDMVLIMTVNPGFGGQVFIPSMLKKIAALKDMIIQSGKNIEIEIDGGVTVDNASSIEKAGADILVAGSAVFNADDPKDAIRRISKGNN